MHYKMIIILICCLLSLTVQAQDISGVSISRESFIDIDRLDFLAEKQLSKDLRKSVDKANVDWKKVEDTALLENASPPPPTVEKFIEKLEEYYKDFKTQIRLVQNLDELNILESDVLEPYRNYYTAYEFLLKDENDKKKYGGDLEICKKDALEKRRDLNANPEGAANFKKRIEEEIKNFETLIAEVKTIEDGEKLQYSLYESTEQYKNSIAEMRNVEEDWKADRLIEYETLKAMLDYKCQKKGPILTDTIVSLAFPIVIEELLVDVATKDTQIIASFEDTAFIQLQKRRVIPWDDSTYVDYWAYDWGYKLTAKKDDIINLIYERSSSSARKNRINEEEFFVGIDFDVKKAFKSHERTINRDIKRTTGVLSKQIVYWTYRFGLDSMNNIIIDRCYESIGTHRYMVERTMEKGEDETGYLMTALTKKSKRSRKKKIIYRHNFKAAFEVLKAEAKEQLDAFEE